MTILSLLFMLVFGILYTMTRPETFCFACLTVFMEAGCHSGKSLELWTHLSPDWTAFTIHSFMRQLPRRKTRSFVSFHPLNESKLKNWAAKKQSLSFDKLHGVETNCSVKSININTRNIEVSYPFVYLLPTASAEAVLLLLWRHVVHPASRRPYGSLTDCPQVM